MEIYEEVLELKSTHEKADTRKIFHVPHASEFGFTEVIVVSENTDVSVVLLGFAS